MHVQFVLLADSATVRPDGRLDATAIGPFTVRAAHFPATVHEFAVITRVNCEAQDEEPGHLVVRVLAPDGSIVAERDSEIEVPPVYLTRTEDRTRTRVLNFFKVPIPMPGVYQLSVRLNDVDFLTRMHFDAEQVPVGAEQPAVVGQPET